MSGASVLKEVILFIPPKDGRFLVVPEGGLVGRYGGFDPQVAFCEPLLPFVLKGDKEDEEEEERDKAGVDDHRHGFTRRSDSSLEGKLPRLLILASRLSRALSLTTTTLDGLTSWSLNRFWMKRLYCDIVAVLLCGYR